MCRIKVFWVFRAAAFLLAVLPGHIRTDQFILDAQLSGVFLKKGVYISFAVGETADTFKTVVIKGR